MMDKYKAIRTSLSLTDIIFFTTKYTIAIFLLHSVLIMCDDEVEVFI